MITDQAIVANAGAGMGEILFEPLERVPVGNSLGEGVLWDDRERCFWWTDILERRLFRLEWPSRSLERFDLPYRLGSFALTTRPGVIVAAFEHGVAHYQLRSGDLAWIARPILAPGVRFNDGRVDRAGRFWAGTMVEDAAAAGGEDRGHLYRLGLEGTAAPQLSGVGISNALCWSPDGSILYHADSRRGSIEAYPVIDESLGRPRPFAAGEPGSVPDGATVDAAGRVWNARWGSGQVAVYTADGQVAARLALSATQPTCVALGGPALDIVAVTTARVDLTPSELDDQPGAGDLFLFRTSARGLPENRVAL